MHSLWRWVRLVLFTVLGFYLVVVVVLLALENRLLYRPASAADSWQPPLSPDVQDVWFTLPDGVKAHGWWHPRSDSKTAVLYFHGNAGNLSHRAGTVDSYHSKLKVGVLIIDYPGYGKSEGSPSEAGCYAASHAAYEWLTDAKGGGIKDDNVLIYGGSLGGGVAIELASQKPHRALIVAKTFTSAPDAAQSIYPFVPANLLMRNRFPSLERLPQCKRPLFIAHGDADKLIPFEQGKRLFDAAVAEHKHFCALPGADHNDPLPKKFFDELIPFLNEKAPIR